MLMGAGSRDEPALYSSRDHRQAIYPINPKNPKYLVNPDYVMWACGRWAHGWPGA